MGLIHNLGPKNKKQVLHKMVRGLKNWDQKNKNTEDNDTISNDIDAVMKYSDFWIDILSSDSSESDDFFERLGKTVIKKAGKKKKKHSKRGRTSFAAVRSKRSIFNEEKEDAFTKPVRSKRSIFLDGAASPNTIQREKLPSRARKARFHDSDDTTTIPNSLSLSQRKHSTFNENAYGETFKLSQDQLKMIDESGIMALIEEEMKQYGIISFDKRNASLKLILSAAGDR
eukprot:974209_1